MMNQSTLVKRLRQARIVPVIDPKDPEGCFDAVASMVSAGVGAIEITLRSQSAYDVLKACRETHPDVVLGAGSVMEVTTYRKAVDAGADFTIAPGRCLDVEAEARNCDVVHIPGVVTPTEIIAALGAGHSLLKYYPSEANGGARSLKDLSRIFPNASFMPSGGIKLDQLADYGMVSGVVSVGGSWMYASAGAYMEPSDIHNAVRSSIEKLS